MYKNTHYYFLLNLIKNNHKESGLLKIASESLCAIIGAIFLHKGGAVTKEFIEKKIFSQKTLNDM